VQDGELAMRCIYSRKRYRPETVQALMGAFKAQLHDLINLCGRSA